MFAATESPSQRETRLGILIPSTNTMMERDAHVYMPPNVSVHFSRMRYDRSTDAPLASMRHHAEAAASLLADADMDVIAFGCTAGSLIGGLEYDTELARSLRETAGVPAITTASAVIDALQAAGATRVTLITPYSKEVNAKVVAYLEEQGIEVVTVGGFNTTDPAQIPPIRPGALLEATLAADTDRSDAIFLSCTALRGMQSIGAIRTATGKPVVTSNQATYRKLILESGDAQLIDAMRGSEMFTCLKRA